MIFFKATGLCVFTALFSAAALAASTDHNGDA